MKTRNIAAVMMIALGLTIQSHAADKKASKKAAERHAAKMEAFGFGKTVEIKLIENYLRGQKTDDQPVTKRAVVYTAQDELGFEGELESDEAAGWINKADFLMEYDNTLYYRINQ